jgi:hypothetical protein
MSRYRFYRAQIVGDTIILTLNPGMRGNHVMKIIVGTVVPLPLRSALIPKMTEARGDLRAATHISDQLVPF